MFLKNTKFEKSKLIISKFIILINFLNCHNLIDKFITIIIYNKIKLTYFFKLYVKDIQRKRI